LIHDYSRGARGPFVPFNCSAIPKDLVESQLFGHKRGAFTGALESFPGVIRAADRGTLFLDELGDLELMTQPNCCGSSRAAKCIRSATSARIASASASSPPPTPTSMSSSNKAGFRRDLYYRVGVARLALAAVAGTQGRNPGVRVAVSLTVLAGVQP
jgi:DNA-binding NtrC family response regulator